MEKQLEKVKGITLIALVITIILLLILAGVSIAILTGEGGILSKANTAKTETNKANAKEQAQIAVLGSYDNNGKLNINELKTELEKIDKVGTITDTNGNFPVKTTIDGQEITIDQNGNVTVEGESSGGDIPAPPKPKSELEKAKEAGTVLDENNPTTITDTYGNEVKVPEGFKIASDSATDVTGGVVIEDTTKDASGNPMATAGSQFVWIPVGDVYTSTENKEETKKTITLGRYVFKEDGSIDETLSKTNPSDQLKTTSSDSSNYTEGLKNSITPNTHAKDIVTFKAKAETSGGYYIGRYEARCIEQRTAKTDDSGLKQITVKPNDYVYNWVTQPQATTLAQEMYGNDRNFTSDLVNSYAWDTAIVFLQTFDDRSESAKTKPYSRQNSLNISLLALQGTNNSPHDKICNIWDMASNEWEWTTETYSNSISPCTATGRGGYCNDSSHYTGFRSYAQTNTATSYHSFRPILYYHKDGRQPTS